MTIFPAAWLPQAADDPDNTTYNRQVSEVQAAIRTYGVDNIEGITVGNEFLLNGGAESELITKMADMRTLLAGMGLSKTLPVGTADAGSMITTTLAQGSDYVMANVHPWFGGVPIDQAAGWVYSYTANQEPSSATLATNDPKVGLFPCSHRSLR
jgi:exo-beta-1,3-glucanase (GH17 family)